MKVWSKGMLLLVMTAAAGGWMAGTATNTPRRNAAIAELSVDAQAVMSPSGESRARPVVVAPVASATRVVMVSRAERDGVSDRDRRSSELIESQRGKPMFGEWSMKYLVVDDALRADVNQDGWLTSEDFAQFVTWMQQGNVCADINADGLMDALDVELFVEAYVTQELIEVRRDNPRRC